MMTWTGIVDPSEYTCELLMLLQVLLLLRHPWMLDFSAAAVYGPTNGPPPGAPAGITPVVDVSARERAMLSRPIR